MIKSTLLISIIIFLFIFNSSFSSADLSFSPKYAAKLDVAHYKMNENYKYQCKADNIFSRLFSSFISLITGKASDEDKQKNQKNNECYQIILSSFSTSWDEKKGGITKTSETTTARYGGETCVSTIIWSPEDWPPTKNPLLFDDTCNLAYSEHEYEKALLIIGPYINQKIVENVYLNFNEKGSWSYSKNLGGYTRKVTHNADTKLKLRVTGNENKFYTVNLKVSVYEVKPDSEGKLSTRRLEIGDYTIAGKRVNSDGEVSFALKGNSELDVTPKANVRYYKWNMDILSLEEK